MKKTKRLKQLGESIGDVVELCSGGPDMTVLSYDKQAGLAECAWYNARFDLKVHHFPIGSLKSQEYSKDQGSIPLASGDNLTEDDVPF